MNRYRKKGRGPTKFVQVYHWLMETPAWKELKPGPRALYVELKKQFNGNNNGSLFLSHRMAAEKLNVNRETVGKYFKDLREKGFILVTRGHCLGPEGVGQSDHYALTEETLDGRPATKDFLKVNRK